MPGSFVKTVFVFLLALTRNKTLFDKHLAIGFQFRIGHWRYAIWSWNWTFAAVCEAHFETYISLNRVRCECKQRWQLQHWPMDNNNRNAHCSFDMLPTTPRDSVGFLQKAVGMGLDSGWPLGATSLYCHAFVCNSSRSCAVYCCAYVPRPRPPPTNPTM